MKTLYQFYQEHQGKVSDKWSLYLTEYDRLFAPYRDHAIRLLEVGIQNGGSLEIWSQYFPNAEKLVGCDINPDCLRLQYDNPVISVVVADACTDHAEESIISHSPHYDIILDDGSHRSGDIIRTFVRYFKYLNDGGLFVAEDLHCSYYKSHEGGLFDPYSSVAFFKRLADLVHHEHWGIEKSRREFLSGFSEHYGIDFDEDLLSTVHSVEFVNSLCVVAKSKTQDNLLGTRFIAGKTESVLENIHSLHGHYIPFSDESQNEWTVLDFSPEEGFLQYSKKVKSLEDEIQSLSAEKQAILDSKSWRLTLPLRVTSIFLEKVKVTALKAWRMHQQYGIAALIIKTFDIIRREGFQGVIYRLKDDGYSQWVSRFDTLTDNDRGKIVFRVDGLKIKPLISVVMPVFDPPPEYLELAIQSVKRQLYPEWELCIADDCSTNPAIRQILERHQSNDKRIKVVFREKNGHISRASNSALELATGEFVALLDHDDLLPEHALFWVAELINKQANIELIYSDEDKIDELGRRFSPYFKCEFNYELLLAQNMMSHLGVYRRSLITKIGGFRVGFEGSQDYDLALRALEQIHPSQVAHIPRVLYHWRAIEGSTALAPGEKSYTSEAMRKAVAEHLKRRGLIAEVLPAPLVPNFNRVRFARPTPQPLVSIIIPTRDRADLLGLCVDSILRRSSYSNYEIIIVDNGSVEPATHALFERFPRGRVRVIRDDSPFNFSGLNNHAVREARGELVCLLNNDIEIVTSDWLEELVSFAILPEIGAVGARLWYPDGRLQHGGIILGLGGVAGHFQKYLPKRSSGYLGRAVLHQAFSAVTAACLLIRRSIYEQVGGFDESFAVAFNDVDFCLRVQKAGFRNVWTPYAEMIHHESATRGEDLTPEKMQRFSREVALMKSRWGASLHNDFAYSPNFTLDSEDMAYTCRLPTE